jgi:plasmid replication initiation protein
LGQLESKSLKSKVEPKSPSEPKITIHNAFVRAAQGLTLSEKRIMSLAISKLDSRKPWTPERLQAKLTAAEFAEQFNIDINTAYEQLMGAGKRLYERSVFWAQPYKQGMTIKTHTRWVTSASYQLNEGWVAFVFNWELAPWLFQLHKEFTSYQLRQASALRSLYSWRLLELISQYKDTGWCQISIGDFCHAMDASERQRANFAKIRTKMIEPAVKELTEKDGWIIRWSPIKAGRKVAALRFEFVRNPQGSLPLEEPAQDPASPPVALAAPERKRPRRARSTPADPAPAAALAPAALDLLEPTGAAA